MELFDATQHEPDVGLDPVPADTYDVVVEDTEKKDIQAGGWRLMIAFLITTGAYAGRKIMINYNIGGTSEENVRISRGQLSAVCHVTGVFKIESPDGTDRQAGANLRGAPLKLKVSNDGKYNSHSQAYDVNGNTPQKAGGGVAAPATAPAATAVPAAAPAPAAAAPVAPAAAPAPAAAFAPAPAAPAAPAQPAPAAAAPVAPAPVAAPAGAFAPAAPTAPAAPAAPAQNWNQAPAAPAQNWNQAQPPAA